MVPSYAWTIIFYSAIILLLLIFRKKFARQGIIFLYRTKFGLDFINKFAKNHKESLKYYGMIGIGVGFAGMIAIIYLLGKNLFDLITKPAAQSGVALVLPGVNVPGSPIQIPLITGWIALFIVIIIHEFSHGIVAKCHDINVKSSGFAFLGPIAGAFVEPDDKKIDKQHDYVKQSIFAAGPFANILLGIIALLLLSYAFIPIGEKMTTPVGFSIGEVQKDFPADKSGLPAGTIITSLNGNNVTDYDSFAKNMESIKPGDTIEVISNGTPYSITVTAKEDDASKPYIGIAKLKNERVLKSSSLGTKISFSILSWTEELCFLLFVLSIGIGTANLLPLGPIDGGRMILSMSISVFGAKKGQKIWAKIGWLTLLLFLANLLFPLFKWIFTSF